MTFLHIIVLVSALAVHGSAVASLPQTIREVHEYCYKLGDPQRSSEACISEESKKLENRKGLCFQAIRELSVPTGSLAQSLKDCLSSTDVEGFKSASIPKLISAGTIVGAPVSVAPADLASWINYSSNFTLSIRQVISAHWSGPLVDRLPSGSGTLDVQVEYAEGSYTTTFKNGRVVVEGEMKQGRLNGPVTLKRHPYDDGSPYVAHINIFENGKNAGLPLLKNRRIGQFVFDDFSGTFRDDQTNTEWFRCAVGRRWNGHQQTCEGVALTITWSSAVAEVSKLQLNSHGDWRLPQSSEVQALFPNGEQKCVDMAKIAAFLFPSIEIDSWFKNYHWLWDNRSDKFIYPFTADLRWGTQRGPCTLVASSILAHSSQPFVVVREGVLPGDLAKLAPKVIAQRAEIDRVSKATGNAANEKFASKVMGGLEKLQRAAAASSSNGSSSGSGAKLYKCRAACTGSWFKRGSEFNAEVRANTWDDARESVVRLANDDAACRSDAKRYNQRMSVDLGSVKCDEKY